MAELSGVSVTVVNRFCSGEVIGSDKLLRMLQVCDDLSLEWLFYGTGEMIRKCGDVTVNVGDFAGVEMNGAEPMVVSRSPGSVVERNGIRVDYEELLRRKDEVIEQKDNIISKRDEMISELQRLLVAEFK